jgi:hypothetical protein
VPKL